MALPKHSCLVSAALVVCLSNFTTVQARQDDPSTLPYGPAYQPPPAVAADLLGRYPAKALAEGIEGAADLRCVPRDGAYPKCEILAESPAGWQFAETARSYMEFEGEPYPEKVEPRLDGCAQPRYARFEFTQNPTAVTLRFRGPNPLVRLPKMITPPTYVDLVKAYPQSALAAKLSGRVLLTCGVSKSGSLFDCEVAEESPAGQGFGQAALKLAPTMSLSPATMDGVPCVGSVRLPIRFAPPV